MIRSSQLIRTSGSSTITSREAPITCSSDLRADPSTQSRWARAESSSALGAVSGVWGTYGQKARRPKIVSIAGSSVSIESAAQKIPIAAIGPSPAVPFTFAIVRHSSAAITVSAEAKIAGPADSSAVRIATWRSVSVCSSSR